MYRVSPCMLFPDDVKFMLPPSNEPHGLAASER